MANPYPATFIDQNAEGRLVGEIDFTDPANRPGLAPVSCVLARDAALDIRAVGDHPILWDALYDNLNDFNALLSIPAGLGLSFTFSGAASTITTTAAGTWSFGYALNRGPDAAWTGGLSTGLQQADWVSEVQLITQVAAIPTAVSLPQVISTGTQATANPYTGGGIYLSIVRLG